MDSSPQFSLLWHPSVTTPFLRKTWRRDRCLSFIIIVESVQRMVLRRYRCQCFVTLYDDISYCVEYLLAFSRQLGRHRFVGSVSISRYRSFNFWHDFRRGWWDSWRRRNWIVSLKVLSGVSVNFKDNYIGRWTYFEPAVTLRSHIERNRSHSFEFIRT